MLFLFLYICINRMKIFYKYISIDILNYYIYIFIKKIFNEI